MPFSLSGGLSEMGKSIASTAGDMIINQQRSDLEKQRIQLAESLAEGRETRGREQQAKINAEAAEKDQAFRAKESLLNREQNTELENTRQAGEDERARLSRDTQVKIHGQTEAAAASRFEKEYNFQVDQAKQLAKDKREANVANLIINQNKIDKVVDVPYITADGEQASKPMKVSVPDTPAVIAGMRKAGLNEMADALEASVKTKPTDAKKANVTGRPPLSSFSK